MGLELGKSGPEPRTQPPYTHTHTHTHTRTQSANEWIKLFDVCICVCVGEEGGGGGGGSAADKKVSSGVCITMFYVDLRCIKVHKLRTQHEERRLHM